MIVEPVVGNMGCVPPKPGYLAALREITAREGTLLIFDEVMTGFRVAFGGASELYNIKPDLTTLGKIIGGGLPVGAYGGPAKIMDLIAPLGPVYQAGTLSGNPLAMAAGIATLCQLKANRETFYKQLGEMTGKLVAGVTAAAKDAGVGMTANQVASMFTFFFTGKQVSRLGERGHLRHGEVRPLSRSVARCRRVAATVAIRSRVPQHRTYPRRHRRHNLGGKRSARAGVIVILREAALTGDWR